MITKSKMLSEEKFTLF